MVLYKILVIFVLCALALAFPSWDTEATTYDPLDPSNEEPLNPTVDYEELQDSTSDPLKSAGNLPPPIEKATRALKDDTDNDLTIDFNLTLDFTPTIEAHYESTQIFVSSPDAETDPSRFLEEPSEASDNKVKVPLAETITVLSSISEKTPTLKQVYQYPSGYCVIVENVSLRHSQQRRKNKKEGVLDED